MLKRVMFLVALALLAVSTSATAEWGTAESGCHFNCFYEISIIRWHPGRAAELCENGFDPNYDQPCYSCYFCTEDEESFEASGLKFEQRTVAEFEESHAKFTGPEISADTFGRTKTSTLLAGEADTDFKVGATSLQDLLDNYIRGPKGFMIYNNDYYSWQGLESHGSELSGYPFTKWCSPAVSGPFMDFHACPDVLDESMESGIAGFCESGFGTKKNAVGNWRTDDRVPSYVKGHTLQWFDGSIQRYYGPSNRPEFNFIAYYECGPTCDEDDCGVCDGGNADKDDCGVCFGGNADKDDCGVCNGGNADIDDCGVCNGGNADIDDCGVCFGENVDQDVCGVCYGQGDTCYGCDGVAASGLVVDDCGDCGGEGWACTVVDVDDDTTLWKMDGDAAIRCACGVCETNQPDNRARWEITSLDSAIRMYGATETPEEACASDGCFSSTDNGIKFQALDGKTFEYFWPECDCADDNKNMGGHGNNMGGHGNNMGGHGNNMGDATPDVPMDTVR